MGLRRQQTQAGSKRLCGQREGSSSHSSWLTYGTLFTSGVLRKERLTPDVRLRESSETMSCRGFTTGMPAQGRKRCRGGVLLPALVTNLSLPSAVFGQASGGQEELTCRHQLGLVLFVAHLLLLHVASREEEAHHAVEKLVRQLDGEGHHVHLAGAEGNIKMQ
uniref:Uncharacterized protein n=1 Tax=Podarcis muralis TaxID=64176 RepID=A0A670JPB2_PODMU